jgi:hypothetical protein
VSTTTNPEGSMSARKAEFQALEFLRDHGPHTMGRIDDEGAFAAALTFLDLEKTGRVRRVNFGNGHIQFSITEAGRAHLTGVAP